MIVIRDYVVLESSDTSRLRDEIKRLLDQGGWVPAGGVSVIVLDKNPRYYQAMKKEHELGKP